MSVRSVGSRDLPFCDRDSGVVLANSLREGVGLISLHANGMIEKPIVTQLDMAIKTFVNERFPRCTRGGGAGLAGAMGGPADVRRRGRAGGGGEFGRSPTPGAVVLANPTVSGGSADVGETSIAADPVSEIFASFGAGGNVAERSITPGCLATIRASSVPARTHRSRQSISGGRLVK